MNGGEGPPGTVSFWSWSPLFFGRPLSLVLYMLFRIFAYSSSILKDNFVLIESMPACGMKLLWLTIHPWGPRVLSSDFMDTYWVSSTFLARLTDWSVTQLMRLNSRMTSSPQQHSRAHMRYQPENNNVRSDSTNRRRFFCSPHHPRPRQRVRVHELAHLAHDGREDGVVQHVLRRE